MKPHFCLPRLLAFAATGMLLGGCLLKPVTVSIHHFVLAPVPANEAAPAATEHFSIGIGLVKMPSYLLRNSMVVRSSANEIEYLEDALWAERLDQCFQRTLAANLSRLMSSESIHLADWGRDPVQARVLINVQQFDVDIRGQGALIAEWQFTTPDSDAPLKRGHARLARSGVSPRASGEIIATTLSELLTEFSRDLAQSIRETVKSKQ